MKDNQKGFTLLEIIVVVAILGILMSIAVTTIGNRSPRMRLKSDARDLVSNMQIARVRAIRDTRTWAIRFDTANKLYIVYSASGEDPPAALTWSDGNEEIFRTVRLHKNVIFGNPKSACPSSNPLVSGFAGANYASNIILFNSDGTSISGEAYLTIASGDTFAINTLASTGRIKLWKNYGNSWD